MAKWMIDNELIKCKEVMEVSPGYYYWDIDSVLRDKFQSSYCGYAPAQEVDKESDFTILFNNGSIKYAKLIKEPQSIDEWFEQLIILDSTYQSETRDLRTYRGIEVSYYYYTEYSTDYYTLDILKTSITIPENLYNKKLLFNDQMKLIDGLIDLEESIINGNK